MYKSLRIMLRAQRPGPGDYAIVDSELSMWDWNFRLAIYIWNFIENSKI